jgi:hypothetical protein
MENFYFPTGKSTNGHEVVCLCCLEDLPIGESEMDPNKIMEELKSYMNERKYCAEAWQVENYMHECGYSDYQISETEMGGAAPLATLNTVSGMGPVTPPQGPGTNANFYDVAKQGSGDKFTSLNVGTPAAQTDDKKKKKKRTIQTFMDFAKAMKTFQGK